jgi:hypothetical protein
MQANSGLFLIRLNFLRIRRNLRENFSFLRGRSGVESQISDRFFQIRKYFYTVHSATLEPEIDHLPVVRSETPEPFSKRILA